MSVDRDAGSEGFSLQLDSRSFQIQVTTNVSTRLKRAQSPRYWQNLQVANFSRAARTVLGATFMRITASQNFQPNEVLIPRSFLFAGIGGLLSKFS